MDTNSIVNFSLMGLGGLAVLIGAIRVAIGGSVDWKGLAFLMGAGVLLVAIPTFGKISIDASSGLLSLEKTNEAAADMADIQVETGSKVLALETQVKMLEASLISLQTSIDTQKSDGTSTASAPAGGWLKPVPYDTVQGLAAAPDVAGAVPVTETEVAAELRSTGKVSEATAKEWAPVIVAQRKEAETLKIRNAEILRKLGRIEGKPARPAPKRASADEKPSN